MPNDKLINQLHFSDSSKGTSNSELLHHLYTNLPHILHLARVDDVLELTRKNILVRRAVLAISAAHLHRVSPSSQHRIAEHFQQHCALREYQLALATSPKQLGQSGVNALVLTGGLLNILAFTLPEPQHVLHHNNDGDNNNDGDAGAGPTTLTIDPSVSWTFEADKTETGADWLCLQAGMHPVLHTLTPFLPETLNLLGNIFLGSDKSGWAFGGIGPTNEQVPPNWASCFELNIPHGDPRSTVLSGGRYLRDVLRPAVRILLHLRDLTPSHENVFRHLQFFGKMPPDFRRLLYRKNVRALWLYGYWLGLMCRFDGVWWCERRVRVGYGVVRAWLERWIAGTGVLMHEQKLWDQMMDEFRRAPEHFVC